MLSFSIISTCYNHRQYLPGLITMLKAQTLKDFELILVDNDSTDGSREWIEKLEEKDFKIQKILNNQNLGICKAFNLGFKNSTGKYLIDLAPDDEFLPQKLKQNLEWLEFNKAHLLFSDCESITENGVHDFYYSKQYPFHYRGKSNYFDQILERHCLASPTTVMSRTCFQELNGYDESLAYEDFDFMLRASHKYDLVYDHSVLVKKRKVKGSFSGQFKKRKSPLHASTLQILKNIKPHCKTEKSKAAFKKRVNTEMKQQIKLLNGTLVKAYLNLLIS